MAPLCCRVSAAAAVAPEDSKATAKEIPPAEDDVRMLRQFNEQLSSQPVSIKDYLDEESILRMLEPGPYGELAPCAVLDGEWLLARADQIALCEDPEARKKLALPRRQQLEKEVPEAYMSGAKLRKLERGDERINSPLPLVCVSHIWRTKDHPDPYCENLLYFAHSVRAARKKERFPAGDFAVFLDWTSLHQRNKGGKRTRREEAAFGHALSKMQLWYAHMKTLVYLMTSTPEEWTEDPVPYEKRGWPSFERMITMILKHQSSKAWATICDTGAFKNPKPGREQRTIVHPPLDVHAFAILLDGLKFTNGADKEMVLRLYKETLSTALEQAPSLRYTGLRWGDKDMAKLVKILPLCRRLKYLNLKGSRNEFTDVSANLFADMLADKGVLPELQFIGAGCTDKEDHERGHDPLLESDALKRACESRDIHLDRDVPNDEVMTCNKMRMDTTLPHRLSRNRSSITNRSTTINLNIFSNVAGAFRK